MYTVRRPTGTWDPCRPPLPVRHTRRMRYPVTLVVVGPITEDITLAVDELPPDAGSAVATDVRVAAGGKGANPAVCAARLGATVRLVGAVGDDPAADAVLGQLAGDGVDVGAVHRDPGTPTGRIVHLVQPGGRRRYVESQGANGRLRIDEPGMRAICDGESVALVSTALPREAVESAVAGARATGAIVVADLAGEAATSRAVLPHAHLVRGDAGEIGELTGCAVRDFDSAAEAGRRLRRQGPRIAVIQARGDGDLVLSDEGEVRLPYLPVDVVDPTGGGDALIATLTVLWAHGGGLERAARLASAAAAHTVARLGGRPGFAGQAELEDFARRHR